MTSFKKFVGEGQMPGQIAPQPTSQERPQQAPQQAPPQDQDQPKSLVQRAVGAAKNVGGSLKKMAQKVLGPVFSGKHAWLWRLNYLKQRGLLGINKVGIDIIDPQDDYSIPREAVTSEADWSHCVNVEKRYLRLMSEAMQAQEFDKDVEEKLGHPNPAIPNLTPKELIQKAKFHFRQKRPLMIWGAPGIGKTDVVKQIAQALGVRVVIIDLSRMDALDMQGLPVPIEGGGEEQFFTYALADIWPKDNGPDEKGGIIFLDEFNNAPERTLAAAHHLLLGRKVGKYEVPSKWAVFAAGNRNTDNPRVSQLSIPVANRLAHINMISTVEDFEKWATGKFSVDEDTGIRKVSPEVLAFLKYRPSLLWDAKAGKATEEKYAVPTPRSWAMASFEVAETEQEEGRTLSEEEVFKIFSSHVGGPAAQEYAEFRTVMQDVNIEQIMDIIENPNSKVMPPKEKGGGSDTQGYKLDHLYAMMSVIANMMKRKSEDVQAFINVINWTRKIDEAEPASYLLKQILAINDDMLKNDKINDALREWMKAYKDDTAIPAEINAFKKKAEKKEGLNLVSFKDRLVADAMK